MGVDCKLLVNARHNVKHIETLVREGLGLKISRTDYKGDHSFLTIDHGTDVVTWLYVAHTTEYGGLDATLLSARANDQNRDLLKRIAAVLGGFLCENDSMDDYIVFDDPHAGNARFVLEHTILTGALTNESSSELSNLVADAVGYNKKP